MNTKRWALALTGALAALPLLEAVFHVRDDGAFPHVNVYVPDAELGVRLQPSTSMKLRIADNPVTTVATNARGYRAPEWPAPSAEEILVVGDSQVFGLGVEQDQTFSAGLAEATGRVVLNGGLPTYGPREYAAVVDEVTAERPVTTVVVVVNFLNDLFELERPNAERHVEWDGWAVRAETAPESVMAFPGRRTLMSRSHLVYGLRGLLRGDAEGPVLPSEGDWEDLLGAGVQTSQLHQQATEGVMQGQAERLDALHENHAKLEEAQDRIDDALRDEGVAGWEDSIQLKAARGDPGDIVTRDYIESSRDVAITADHIRRAARLRGQWEERLRDQQDLALRGALRDERRSLRAQPLPVERPSSVLKPWVEELQALCVERGADLVVVALPVDVQVSSAQWAKYGEPEQDMSESLVLLEDLVFDARALGLRALDLTSALRGAGEGAFLNADIHMSPSGHEAVAAALAQTLGALPPVRPPQPGVPEGRSLVPEPQDWALAPEITVRGSSRAGCWTLQIDEWLRVTCRDEGRNHPSGLDVDHPEARVVVTEFAATLVVPRSRAFTADFHWQDRSQTLNVEAERIWFGDPWGEGRALTVTKADEDLCKCHVSVHREKECEAMDTGRFAQEDACEISCETLYGDVRGCDYQDCNKRLLCAQGDPLFPPTCDRGEWDVLGLCRPLCDDLHPCEVGECTEWMGSGVCL